jgi:hypothetical protein
VAQRPKNGAAIRRTARWKHGRYPVRLPAVNPTVLDEAILMKTFWLANVLPRLA